MPRAILAAPLVLAALVLAPAAPPGGQSAGLPTVIAADVPLYPRDLVRNGVSGTIAVRARIATDGQRVTTVEAADAPPALAGLTTANLKTWRFAPHVATTFDVVFRYAIVARSCDSLGRDTRPIATLRFPTTVEVTAEIDPICDGVFPPPPTFGVYITRATVPFYPSRARDRGIEGVVRIGVSAKGVLTIVEGAEELGDPMILAIRSWALSPPPFAEELDFTFRVIDGDCRNPGPTVIVGPQLTSFAVTATRGVPCTP